MEYAKVLPTDFQLPKSSFWIRKDFETNPFTHVRIEKGDRILDCGAYVGTFACAAMEQGASFVRCFEPEPKNFSCLTRNLARYGDRVELWNAALVSAPVARVTLHLSGFTGAHSIMGGKGKTLSVMALNFRMAVLGEQPQVLKVDIEGAEYDLCDSLRAGDLKSVRSLFVEFHPIADKASRMRRVLDYVEREGLVMAVSRPRRFTANRPLATVSGEENRRVADGQTV